MFNFENLPLEERVKFFIQQRKETEYWDFKEEWLDKEKLIKIELAKLDADERNAGLTPGDKYKKAEVAAKQSLRNDILKIEDILSFKSMILNLKNYDLVILAYEKEQDIKLKDVLRNMSKDIRNIAVIIGPEGGIDEEEATLLVNNGANQITLGKRILRTETAPVAISAMIMYELDY